MSEKTSPFPGLHREQSDGSPAEGASGAVARRSRLGLVPADYAEKTMNSLLSLHQDLMAEKERALDVTRRLMAAQQDRAELESYVRLLEAELQRKGGPAMGSLRAGGNGGLQTASEAVLRSLAGGVPPPVSAPEASPPGGATAAAAPELQPAPVPVAPVPVAPAAPEAAAPEAAAPEAPPRPPRPSAAYRAPVAPASPSAEQSAQPGPEASAEPATEATPRTAAEGWRQW